MFPALMKTEVPVACVPSSGACFGRPISASLLTLTALSTLLCPDAGLFSGPGGAKVGQLWQNKIMTSAT